MSFSLRILEGKNQGDEYPLIDGENLIGRSRSSHIRVYNEDVSGKHFILEITPQGAVIHNISAYGTRVDGVEVQKDAEIHPGQVISAGKTLKLLFAQFQDDEPQQEANENTCVTKFVSAVSSEEKEDSDNETSVTKLVSEKPQNMELENAEELSEQTSVTKFATETNTAFGNNSEPDENITHATQFAGGMLNNSNSPKELEKTQAVAVEEFADSGRPASDFEKTQNIPMGDDDTTEAENRMPSISAAKTEGADTQTAVIGKQRLNDKSSENTKVNSASQKSGLTNSAIAPEALNSTSATNSSVMEEQGMFFEEADAEDAEKTNANETQVNKTRLASLDEMNFIKNQLKKQQQSRLFFKFLVFMLLFVFLGILWKMKAPQRENVLSWPHRTKGNQIEYLTANIPAWDGYQKRAFDLYYPLWQKSKVESNASLIVIHSYLGKKGEVPLEIVLQREDSLSHVYENRENALKGALKRLSEKTDEMYNFDSNSLKTFLTPAYGSVGNGIPCDVVTYQKDKDRSWFGILRFFRYGKSNYILRVEVPAAEKYRALPVLTSDSFLTIHPQFVRSHWEGNNEYIRGDIERMLMGVKDELFNHNSPMQYPRLELTIKSILAQARYNDQKKYYTEGMELLLLLREKQQQWYNGQRIRWASAEIENNKSEKMKIRNESEAVFSILGDKRRYDILRDYWEY